MTVPALLMPDAEELLVAFLAEQFPNLTLCTELFLGFEDEVPLLRVARIGGAQVRPLVLDGPRMDIDCYARSRAAASQLAREVAAVMPTAKAREFAGGLVTSVAEDVGPSWRPEYNPQLWHFGCTYTLTVRPTH